MCFLVLPTPVPQTVVESFKDVPLSASPDRMAIATECYQMFFNYLSMSFPLQPSFALTVLYRPNLVSLLLVGWQSPSCKLAIDFEYFTGMKPLATFRATINSISIRDSVDFRDVPVPLNRVQILFSC